MRAPSSCFSVLLLLAVARVAAGGEPAPAADPDFAALVAYYQGHWQCAGHFANGKAISSQEQFEPWLDGAWLHELHDDHPPFSYHAHSVWGVARPGGALVLNIYDNFGGSRIFSSANWKGTAITFDGQPSASGRRERFVYRRQAPATFSIEYQVSAEGGEWRLGDHVDCSRKG